VNLLVGLIARGPSTVLEHFLSRAGRTARRNERRRQV